MYYADKPISTIEDDSLNRRYFAQLMAKALINFPNSDTFTIGLYGSWGSGKTSLINMMLKAIKDIEKENLIIVKFEPWNFSNTNQLLEQFFIHLTNELSDSNDKKMREVGKALIKYSDAFEIAKFIPHVGEILSLLGKNGSKTLGKKLKKVDEKDVFEQKENVSKLLNEQEKRVLIVIDDIDRLNNEQIRQVFQLITSVAKFPNIIYLLAFDKEIVVKALESVQEGRGENYLEKIIQMPIQLPDICQFELRKVLFSRLDEIISNFKGVMFEKEHWNNMFEPCVEPLITNLRDINRISNSIQFKLSALATEVDFTDLLVISAVEIVYPFIYAWVKENKSILTGEFDYSEIFFRDKTQEEKCEIYSLKLGELIAKCNRNSENEITKVMDILSRLFPYFGKKVGKVMEEYNLDLFRKYNRIAHPEKFERYFDLNVEYIKLRTSQIKNAIHVMNPEELCDFIMELDKEEVSYDFLQEIKASMDDIMEDRAKTIIKSIFNCASEVDMVTRESLFSLSAKNYAEQLALHLFEKIDEKDRFEFLQMQIKNSNLNSLPIIARIINMVELGYGRLAANGEEREYEKIITLKELEDIEDVFSKKVRSLLNHHSIFDFSEYRAILHLMKNFAPSYTETYMKGELQKSINVLKYLTSFVATWSGNEVNYEILRKYESELTKDRILGAIQKELKTKGLFDLPEANQRLCAAFYLNAKGKVHYDGNVSQKDADDLLVEWKRLYT